jgi:nucleotide-binding universal stress UspA family protein
LSIRNILVPVIQGIDPSAQLDAALQVARFAEVHISLIFIRPDAPIAAATDEPSISEMMIASGVTVRGVEDEGTPIEKVALQKFDAWRTENNLALGFGDDTTLPRSASWHERPGPVEKVVSEAGRLNDLIILNRASPLEPATQRMFDAAVFGTGRPTLFVPDAVPAAMLHHVVVAWNGSLQAVRAVAAAMPLLIAAETVSIFTTPSHAPDIDCDLDLGEQLKWRGIKARRIASKVEDASAGTALLTLSGAAGATMLVMGAYARSRVRERLLGGVTHDVVHHAAIPVLMMH